MNPVDVMLWAVAGICVLAFILVFAFVVAGIYGLRHTKEETPQEKDNGVIRFDV